MYNITWVDNTIQLRRRKVELVSLVAVVDVQCVHVFFLRRPMANQLCLKLDFYSLDGFLLYALLIHVVPEISLCGHFSMTWMKWPTFAPVFVSFFSIIHLFRVVHACWHLTATNWRDSTKKLFYAWINGNVSCPWRNEGFSMPFKFSARHCKRPT